MNKKQLTIPLAALALMVSAGGGIVAAAHADTTAPTTTAGQVMRGGHAKPAVRGTVTAISGSTITLKDGKTNTSYTIDASNAKITKHEAKVATESPTAPTTITVGEIALGDTLTVQGTVTGTNVTATTIADGIGGSRGETKGRGSGVTGKVTSVNGTTLTVVGDNGTTYTVDASSGVFTKMQTIAVTDISVGDTVGIQGTVSGTSVVATHIVDGLMTHARTASVTTPAQ
jgi:hypothetical protein